MRAAKAATQGRDVARVLTDKLSDVIAQVIATTPVLGDDLLNSIPSVLQTLLGAIPHSTTKNPDRYLVFRFAELAGAPDALLNLLRSWWDSSDVGTSVVDEKPRLSAASASPKPEWDGVEAVQMTVELLQSMKSTGPAIMDANVLRQMAVVLNLDLSETDISKLLEYSFAEGAISYFDFARWVFGGRVPPPNGSLDKLTPDCTVDAPSLAPGHRGFVATSKRGIAPGPPPKKAMPPKGKPVGPPPPKKASPHPKAGACPAPVNATCAPKPVETLADALKRRKGELRIVESPADSAPRRRSLSDEEIYDELRERRELILGLQRLGLTTDLGVVNASQVIVLEDDTVSLGKTVSTSLLGRGKFASVVRAIATSDTAQGEQRCVAAKRFATTISDVVKVPLISLRAASHEVEALCAIGNHPNVVKLIGLVLPSPDSSVEDVAMARLSPPLQLLLSQSVSSLFGLIRDDFTWQTLEKRGRRFILLDAACGLTAVHNANFAHLDVKSHNILVDPHESGRWCAQICDLGAAYRLDSSSPPPSQGTSGWTAPEILEPPPGAYPDPRLADIFSFGVVMWEVDSGPGANHPLCGLAGDDYCAALLEGLRPSFADEFSEEAALASRCWQFEADKRPPLSDVCALLRALVTPSDSGGK